MMNEQFMSRIRIRAKIADDLVIQGGEESGSQCLVEELLRSL